MKIAEIADVLVAVPPPKYGGTEFIVSLITEGLIKRGHDVTLFATQDSKTKAKLVSSETDAFGFNPWPNQLAELHRIKQLLKVVKQAPRFDILHNHLFELFPFSPYLSTPIITTMHANPSDPIFQQILKLKDVQNGYFIAICDAQRKQMPHLPFIRTVYHGMNVQDYDYQEQPQDYLLFLGRISPEKGPEIAVKVARETGRKLIVAAKYDMPLSPYARKILRLFERTPNVEFIGEVGGQQKKDLLANASALLMPIQWEEPFGLVVTEALASGTPVIAFKRGSMPEIIRHGETGFLVKTTKEMIKAVSYIPRLSRRACRQHVKNNFSVDQMVKGYEKAFTDVLARHPAAISKKLVSSLTVKHSTNLTTVSHKKQNSAARKPRIEGHQATPFGSWPSGAGVQSIGSTMTSEDEEPSLASPL
jgi:glycosyltransferase involved in cell wall biosynthesis